MSDPRRHHILPKKIILARFVDGNGHLWVHDKRQPNRVFPASPDKAFVVTDLNSFDENNGSRNTGLERWYAWLDGLVAPVVQKIVNAADMCELPGLSIEEKNIWDNFLYHQQKRAPDAFERLGLEQRFEADLPGFIEQFERTVRPLTGTERAEFADPKVLKRLLQQTKVRARGKGGPHVVELLAKRGLAIGVIASTMKSFVIGDHPFARMGPSSNLGHRQLELWLPLSAEVAVSPWGDAGTESIVTIAPDDVRRINEVIFRQSKVVAGRAERLLRSLAGLR